MTDNEKAATFIPWQRCTCSGPPFGALPSIGIHGLAGQCGTCYGFFGAPDMTKPENYMQALETLPRKYNIDIEDRWQVTIQDPERPEQWTFFSVDTNCGVAVLKTLALLYDAEHPLDDQVGKHGGGA